MGPVSEIGESGVSFISLPFGNGQIVLGDPVEHDNTNCSEANNQPEENESTDPTSTFVKHVKDDAEARHQRREMLALIEPEIRIRMRRTVPNHSVRTVSDHLFLASRKEVSR